MSNNYAKVSTNFYTHRKTVRLKGIIGDDAYWIPPRMWGYAIEHQPDGNLSDFTSEELAIHLGCERHASCILDALKKTGFMDDNGWIHNWEKHEWYHRKKQQESNKRAAEIRWERERAEKAEREADPAKVGKVDDSTPPPKQVTSERFTPPTIEEVKSESIKREWPPNEAIKFHAFYESKGWKVGSQSMKKWQAAMTTWQSKDGFGINGNSKPPTKSTNPAFHREAISSPVLKLEPKSK